MIQKVLRANTEAFGDQWCIYLACGHIVRAPLISHNVGVVARFCTCCDLQNHINGFPLNAFEQLVRDFTPDEGA